MVNWVDLIDGRRRVRLDTDDEPEPCALEWVRDNAWDVWSRGHDGQWTCRTVPGKSGRPWSELLWKYGDLTEMTEEDVDIFFLEREDMSDLERKDMGDEITEETGPSGETSEAEEQLYMKLFLRNGEVIRVPVASFAMEKRADGTMMGLSWKHAPMASTRENAGHHSAAARPGSAGWAQHYTAAENSAARCSRTSLARPPAAR